MKKLIYILIMGGMFSFIGCGDVGDYPKKSDDYKNVDPYVLPKAKVLTQEERDAVQAERDEYTTATEVE